MGNKTLTRFDAENKKIPLLVVDNGDGTYSFAVSTSVTTNGLTDAQLRASDVKISLDGETVSFSPGSYRGEQVIAGNGANQNSTLPSGTKFIWISAEGGKAYVSVNAAAAPTTSGLYIPDGQIRSIGPYASIISLGVYAAVGVSVHLIYES
jgi:hypothetical protein